MKANNNIIQHPARTGGTMRRAGGALLSDLDGVLTAVEQGLLVIAPDVDAEQAGEMRRELRCARWGLDAVKETAGITGYCGSFHLCRDEVGGAA